MREFACSWDTRDARLESAQLSAFAGSGLSFETTIVHTAGASLKIAAASGVSGNHSLVTANTERVVRFYVRVTARPSTTARILFGTSTNARILLNPNGTLAVYTSTSTLIGTSSVALTDTTKWYRVEFRNPNNTARVLLKIDGVDQVTDSAGGGTFTAVVSFGPADTVADTYTAYIDDVVTDSHSDKWIGDTQLALLLPISDNARAAKWTGGAGGTTNLWDAINNTPPVGVASASATNTSQIEHAGNGAGNEDYDANLTTYSTAGVATLASRQDASGGLSSVIRGIGSWPSDNGAPYWSTSFVAAATGRINLLKIAFDRFGNPTDNVVVELFSDNAGLPNTSLGTLLTSRASAFQTSTSRPEDFFDVSSANLNVTSGTRYHLVVSRSGAGSSTDYLAWRVRSAGVAGENSYSSTTAASGSWGGALNTTFYFDFVIGSGDVVLTCVPMFAHGEDINTGTKNLSYGMKSNPQLPNSQGGISSQFTAGGDVGAVGTYPTNWSATRANSPLWSNNMGYVQVPDVTVGSSPVMTARRPGTESRVASVCFMGMYVEWVTLAAPSGAVTVTPGVADLQLNGFAPNVGLPRTVTPGFADLQLTGFAPQAERPYNVSPGVAQLTLNGFAPVVGLPRTVTPGAADLQLTGFAPVVSIPRTVTVGLAQLVLDGFAPFVDRSKNVFPGTADLQLTGFAPTVGLPRTVTPGVAQLTMNGFAPTVQFPREVFPGVANLVLNGFAPNVGLPRTVTPGVAQLVLDGFAPFVGRPLTVTVGLAQLTLTGFAPNVGLPRTVTPGVAQLVLDTFSPSFGTEVNVFIGTADLVLTGFAPFVQVPRTVTPGVADLQLNGFAPNVGLPRTVTPGVAQLTLTGFAPSLSLPVTITVGTAQLTLDTFAPSLTAAITVTIGTAQLTLTGFAPNVGLPRTVTPGTAGLQLTSFAPLVQRPTNVFPGVAQLVLDTFSPTAGSANPTDVHPGTAVLVMAGHSPVVFIGFDVPFDAQFTELVENHTSINLREVSGTTTLMEVDETVELLEGGNTATLDEVEDGVTLVENSLQAELRDLFDG